MAGIGIIDIGRTQRFTALLVASLAVLAFATITLGVTSAQATPMPINVPGNWEMRFDEEFNSAGLNTSVWTPEWPGGSMSGQCTSPSLVHQSGNGYLELQVQPTSGGCSNPDTGSLIQSNPADGVPGHSGFLFSYGYVEWHVYIPGVRPAGWECPQAGCLPDWPGLWSLPENHETEIDTMEGLKGKACFTVHHFVNQLDEKKTGCGVGSYAGGWHTFGVDWEPGIVKYYYDGTQLQEFPWGYINSTPQYLAMDMVPPGSYGGPLVAPDSMLVDYVRVWQHPTSSANSVLVNYNTTIGTSGMVGCHETSDGVPTYCNGSGFWAPAASPSISTVPLSGGALVNYIGTSGMVGCHETSDGVPTYCNGSGFWPPAASPSISTVPLSDGGALVNYNTTIGTSGMVGCHETSDGVPTYCNGSGFWPAAASPSISTVPLSGGALVNYIGTSGMVGCHETSEGVPTYCNGSGFWPAAASTRISTVPLSGGGALVNYIGTSGMVGCHETSEGVPTYCNGSGFWAPAASPSIGTAGL